MSWRLEGQLARTQFAAGTLAIETTDPRGGWRFEDGVWQGSHFARLPRIAPAPAGAERDAYIRGDDLIMTRGACTADPFRVQTYVRLWNQLPVGLTGACELVLSIQTPLWETSPELTLETALPGVRNLRQTADTLHVETTAGSFVLCTHPLDFVAQTCERIRSATPRHAGIETPTVEPLDTLQISQRLFGQRLEKGVILRSRLWFGWGTTAVTERDWATCRERFVLAPPMLTA